MLGWKTFKPKKFYQFSPEERFAEDYLPRRVAVAMDLAFVRRLTTRFSNDTRRPGVDPQMAVRVPVRGGRLDGPADLLPTLDAAARECQRAQELPPRLDQGPVGGVPGLEDELPARMRQVEQPHGGGAVDVQVVAMQQPVAKPVGNPFGVLAAGLPAGHPLAAIGVGHRDDGLPREDVVDQAPAGAGALHRDQRAADSAG